MNITAKLTAWCYVVILCSAGGLGLGWACDRLLWEWSYDYVFPEGACRNGGLRLGFLLGTILAAVAVVGHRPLPYWRSITRQWLAALLATSLIALVAATLAWALAKWGGIVPSDEPLHPLSRRAFCATLVDGAYYGAWTAATVWMVAMSRLRTSRFSPESQCQL